MTSLARALPEQRFVFVVSSLNNLGELPANVRVEREIDVPEFTKLMSEAFMVVVPLKADTGSSGQMLCLQAMRMGKPIVYADVSSISYYFTPQSGIPYKRGDADSLVAAVSKMLADKKDAMEMGRAAWERSKSYTTERRYEMIDNIITDTI